MHISIFMGPFARGPRDDRPLIDLCLREAERAAADGFSLVSFGEQHFNNYEPYCNPLLMGARLSPVLGDTWFATTILPLPYHNPIRLAEDLNILDQLLNGRFIAGMSAGRVGFSPDFENFGLDPSQQREIFAEKMTALRTLWNHRIDDGPVAFTGPWVKGGMHGRLMPIPYRAGAPLVAIGTNTDPLIHQAGKDGNVLFLGPCGLEDARAKMALYRKGLESAEHSAAVIAQRVSTSMIHHQFVVAETDEAAWAKIEKMMGFHPLLDRREDKRTLGQMHYDAVAGRPGATPVEIRNANVVESWIVAGSPGTVIEAIKARADAGFEMVHTRFGFGPYDPDGWNASYSLFVKEVMPHLGVTPIPAPGQSEIHPDVLAGPLPVGGPPKGPMGIAAADSQEPARLKS
ncbi:LLM class flavin-dependent oxidoreductase [Brevundimonas sp.]|uniref:LLM class flavin-dependent oxidoreductase n=1 Tax=Brevundimonas sp. TaxID=1871086 RepID=UPI003D0D15C3